MKAGFFVMTRDGGLVQRKQDSDLTARDGLDNAMRMLVNVPILCEFCVDAG